jgi:hypothetical protein
MLEAFALAVLVCNISCALLEWAGNYIDFPLPKKRNKCWWGATKDIFALFSAGKVNFATIRDQSIGLLSLGAWCTSDWFGTLVCGVSQITSLLDYSAVGRVNMSTALFTRTSS